MLEASLASLDRLLTQRLNVPTKLLMDDYTNSSTVSSGADCSYRFFGTTWIAPWGTIMTWLLPPSAVVSDDQLRITLRVPQSRMRHFLSDTSLYMKVSPQGLGSRYPRISSAVLRLGPDKNIQSLDSVFACDVALIYKRGIRLDDARSYDPKEESITLITPLLLETPLRTLPLFLPNTPLPEIEYTLLYHSGIEAKNIQFISEFISSTGEADIQQGPYVKSLPPVIQHLPSFLTFRSEDIPSSTDETTVNIPVSTKSDEKLARCLYIKVSDSNNNNDDIPDAIVSIDVLTPGPNPRSLLIVPYPGSLCRTHLKSRFGFTSGDKATRLPYKDLPYYVLPFASTPCGQSPDYGVPLPEGSNVRIILYPAGSSTGTSRFVEVAVEFFTKTVWQRDDKP